MAVLMGKKSYLNSFDDNHLNDSGYLNWVRDYDVIKTLNKIDYLRPVSFEEVNQYCKSLMRCPNSMFFAIHTKESKIFVGTLKVSSLNWHNRTADVGIMIGDKSYWGKGIATDALNIICKYLFKNCGIRKLTAGYMENNAAMKKTFNKLGFKVEGIIREQDFFEGQYLDHIQVGCFAHEYYQMQEIKNEQ